MPPPISRPTLLSATKASIVDEKKRLERCSEIQTRSDKGIAQSKSKVFGTTVCHAASKPQVFYAFRKGRKGIPEDEGKSPPISRPTILNATRALIVDEKERLERYAEIQTRSDKGISQSKSKVFGTTVPRTASKPQVFYTPREGRRGIPEDEGKSPPISRPTILSAARALIFDEKKRLERYAEIQTRSDKGIAQSKSKVLSTTVSRTASKPQVFYTPREGRGDIQEDRGKSRGITGRFSETGIRYDTGTNTVKQVTDKECDPEKDRDVYCPSSGATGDISSTGILPAGDKFPTESPQGSDNLKFYQNNLLSRPSPGYTIDSMLKYKGEYNFFDDYPGFIHWLFPVPETTGRNAEAQSLYEHEAKAIRNDDELISRVHEAFIVILDFFGMCISKDIKGIFRRNKNTYKERYEYLQRYKNNYLRITRIIISIGELGLERFQVPWVYFLIMEGIDNAMFPTLDGQCIKHWISAIKDDGEKHAMFSKYQNLLGHKALIAFEEEENREADMEVDNDVYIGHSIGHTTKHDADINFEIVGSWGFDLPDFV